MNFPPETAFVVLALVAVIVCLLILRARGRSASGYVVASAAATGAVLLGARVAMGVLAPSIGLG